MSDYEFEDRGDIEWNEPGLKSLFKSRGRRCTKQRLYEARASELLAVGDRKEVIRSLAPDLFNLVYEPWQLYQAWSFLAKHNGQAPGRDERRFSQYSRADVWGLVTELSDAIRDGTYRPQREYLKKIDKANGSGKRCLVIQSIVDRVVQRAAFVVLQPLFDKMFVAESFGYRPKRGRLHALAVIEQQIMSKSQRVWLAHDIRDAYGNVRLPQLFELLRDYLPDERLMAFLERVLVSRKVKGLRQGGPLSPLMLNFYLHHLLDLPWRTKCPNSVLVRYADDLCCGGTDVDTVVAHDQALRSLLKPVGMRLKATCDDAVKDLSRGEHLEFLGYRVDLCDGQFRVQILNQSRQRLRQKFRLAHCKNHSQLRADRIARGWLASKAAAYSSCDPLKICRKIHHVARKYGFEEISSVEELKQIWGRAYVGWIQLRESLGLPDPA